MSPGVASVEEPVYPLCRDVAFGRTYFGLFPKGDHDTMWTCCFLCDVGRSGFSSSHRYNAINLLLVGQPISLQFSLMY